MCAGLLDEERRFRQRRGHCACRRLGGREAPCVAGCGGGHGRRGGEAVGKTKIDLRISASYGEAAEGIIELRGTAGSQNAQRGYGTGGHGCDQQDPPVTGDGSEE